MVTDLDLYTGELQYQGIEFSFVFDGNELRLIPPKDKRHYIETEWLMTSLANGVYIPGKTLLMEETYLLGKCNENGNTLIFLPKQSSEIGYYNSVLFVEILAYINCKLERDFIDRITFSGPELNCIHPVTNAFSYTLDQHAFSNSGVFTLTTLDFDSTTTQKQPFMVDDVEVNVQFCVSRSISKKIDSSPVSLNSSMLFEFAPTNNYSFILKLWFIAKQFIQFLCYRKNVFLPTAELYSPYKDGKHEKFATLHILNEFGDSEPETLSKGRYIKQQYISGYEGKILSDIANHMLYTRHFPDTYKAGRHIDAARFVMITAAFEWEFHRAYPDGVPRKPSKIKIETTATNAIEKLIDSSTGKLKEKYKFLKKLIKSDSLQTEIIQVGKDFDAIVGGFGEYLYQLNGKQLTYSEMGQRLADQRNHFAHGDLDQDFIGLSLLDLIYTEYIIYAMQLSFYGVETENIQHIISELFHCFSSRQQ